MTYMSSHEILKGLMKAQVTDDRMLVGGSTGFVLSYLLKANDVTKGDTSSNDLGENNVYWMQEWGGGYHHNHNTK